MEHFLNTNGVAFTSWEFYPRARPTEFYRTMQPRRTKQSQRAEHPMDMLTELAAFHDPLRPRRRIQPPLNSGTQLQRNFYFS
ncbi:uncharacterized protein LOC115626927 [Scaptodrosophila lebanonensis]|uniref:Uncharacterized protein LOC115626927 n=1 Tax=Drosophila lebanonensis TaxID=7225 RepID=A0A6J2TQI9_DROLE|nr:uncharacterized protein LOC115626927 [Scaptodrosophila lebanonensis]